jgi:hypothetical protein
VDAEVIGKAAVTALGAAGPLIAFLNSRVKAKDLRSGLTKDLDLLERLPGDSTERDALLAHIDRLVKQVSEEDQVKRNLPGMGFAGSLLIVCILSGWWIISLGGWWYLAFVPLAFLFILASVGLGQESRKIKRPEQSSTDLRTEQVQRRPDS